MKKLFVIAAVASFATSAYAAPAKPVAKTVRKQSAAPVKPAAGKAATPSNTAAQPLVAPGKPSPGPGSPATGSNVLTTDQQPAKAENTWSAAFVSEIAVAANEANNTEVKDKNVTTTNYVGLGYKASLADKIGIRQYFSAAHKVAEGKGTNEVTAMDAAVTWSHKSGKLFGSDAVTPTLFYFAPTSEMSQSINSRGKLRVDAEFDFTLTPKWTVGYFMSGRQSLVPDGITKDAKGVESPVFAKSNLIHYGVAYYNMSDVSQAYGYAGYSHVWQSSTAILTDEEIVGGLGFSYAMLGGKLTLNPELAYSLLSVKGGNNVQTGGPALAENNLTYQLVAAVAF